MLTTLTTALSKKLPMCKWSAILNQFLHLFRILDEIFKLPKSKYEEKHIFAMET